MDKKQQIVNLWRTCFGDSEAFISLYFDRVYKDENAMTIEKDGTCDEIFRRYFQVRRMRKDDELQ